MREFLVASLTVFATVALVGHLVSSVRAGHIGLGKIFGKTREYSWSSQPVRFVLVLLVYAWFVPLMGWATLYAVAEVAPMLWTLWPGWLGPIAAAVLLKRDRAGSTQRLAAAAQDATATDEPSTDYRTAPARDDDVLAALDRALEAERQRRLRRLAPALMALAPAVAFAIFPPPSGAWLAVGAGLPLVLIAGWTARRSARAASEAAETARALHC